jgi:hypothetical protein
MYIHLIEDYYSRSTYKQATEIREKLIEVLVEDNNVFIETMISPSYTSAIAQIIQVPGISGMPNNMILFEFDKNNMIEIYQIAENIPLAKAGNMDVCILGSTDREPQYKQGIHVWIRSNDFENTNLMVLLSYVILGHPDWNKSRVSIFEICSTTDITHHKQHLAELIQQGKLLVSSHNVEIVPLDEDKSPRSVINEMSRNAALTIIGFREGQLKQKKDLFMGFDELGDVLFVNAARGSYKL